MYLVIVSLKVCRFNLYWRYILFIIDYTLWNGFSIELTLFFTCILAHFIFVYIKLVVYCISRVSSSMFVYHIVSGSSKRPLKSIICEVWYGVKIICDIVVVMGSVGAKLCM